MTSCNKTSRYFNKTSTSNHTKALNLLTSFANPDHVTG